MIHNQLIVLLLEDGSEQKEKPLSQIPIFGIPMSQTSKNLTMIHGIYVLLPGRRMRHVHPILSMIAQ